MDNHTLCRQRNSIGGGYLRSSDNVPANGNGGGFVHPLCCYTASTMGDTAPNAQIVTRNRGRTPLAAHSRNTAHGSNARFRAYHRKRQMVVHGNADVHKHAKRLARPLGTMLLQTTHDACTGNAPYCSTDTVGTDGYGTHIRFDDNGRRNATNIFPTESNYIFMVLRMLHSGRSLPPDDTYEFAAPQKTRQQTHTITTAMAMETKRLAMANRNIGYATHASRTDVL